nr:zinc ABC transporter substrate-binding protein [Thalassobacillus pellis]
MTACGKDTTSDKHNTDGKLQIYTTVYSLKDFTEKIGGQFVEVSSILPPGTDSHTFEPDTQQMIEIAEADAFIYNGAGLEGYASQIADVIEEENVSILEAAKGIDLKKHTHDHVDTHGSEDKESEDEAGHAGHEGHNHGERDPHVWLDPILSIKLAEQIKDLLIEMKPDRKEAFTKNFQQLKKELTDLDQEFHEKLSAQEEDKIIVSHAAYGYWEEAYGLEQISIAGLSPTDEPSQKELEKIIEIAEQNNINHVLFEQNVTSKVAEVVKQEIGGEALQLHNISVLTEEDIANNEDYFSLMKQNLQVLVKALGE